MVEANISFCFLRIFIIIVDTLYTFLVNLFEIFTNSRNLGYSLLQKCAEIREISVWNFVLDVFMIVTRAETNVPNIRIFVRLGNIRSLHFEYSFQP